MTSILKKMLAATRLTRSADLSEAVTKIQQTLAAVQPSAPLGPVAGLPRASSLGKATSSMFARLLGDPETRAASLEPLFRMPAADIDGPSGDAEVGTHFVESSYTAASGTRGYKLFTPSGLTVGTRVPLVVMLHGCTQDPDDFAAGTRMNELAQQHGFMVLYPAQGPRSNVSKCWNWFVPADQHRGRGEPDLLAGMTRHVLQTQPIDPARVYVAGLSAGGAMAAILGREYPDLFAAVGVHSGLPPGAAHDVASAFAAMQQGAAGAASSTAMPASSRAGAVEGRSPPIIVFHGDRDSTVHPSNGDRVIDALTDPAAAGGSLERLVETGPVDAARGRRFTRTLFRQPGAAGAQAEHWVIHGAGHAWAGGSQEGSYTDPTGPDASREMVRFFEAHPRLN